MALIRRSAIQHHAQHPVLLPHEENADGSSYGDPEYEQPHPTERSNELSTVGRQALESGIPVQCDGIAPTAFRGTAFDTEWRFR